MNRIYIFNSSICRFIWICWILQNNDSNSCFLKPKHTQINTATKAHSFLSKGHCCFISAGLFLPFPLEHIAPNNWQSPLFALTLMYSWTIKPMTCAYTHIHNGRFFQHLWWAWAYQEVLRGFSRTGSLKKPVHPFIAVYLGMIIHSSSLMRIFMFII